MRLRLPFLLGLLLLLVPLEGRGQPAEAAGPVLTLRTYTRADGLPSNFILCMLQDREGFLWFGTDSGLARYDGHSFVTFTTRDGLPGNFVKSLHQTHDGVLWAGMHEGGAAWFDGTRFHVVTVAEAPDKNAVDAITSDSFGRVYLRTPQRFLQWTEGTTAVPLPDWPTDRFARLFSVATDTFLFTIGQNVQPMRATPNGMEAFGAPLLLPSPLLHIPQATTLGTTLILNTATEDQQSRLFSWTPASSRLAFLGRANGGLQTIAAMPDGTIYAGERQGLSRITPEGSRTYTVADGLSTPFVTALLVDYEGTLWIGTHGGGVQKLIGTHLRRQPLAETLSGTLTHLYTAPDGTLWIAGDHGLTQMTPETLAPLLTIRGNHAATRLAQRSANRWFTLEGPTLSTTSHPRNPPDNRQALASVEDWFSSLYLDASDTLWAGTYGRGVLRFHDNRLVDTLTTTDGLPTNMIEAITATSEAVWFFTRSHGLIRYRRGRLRTFGEKDGLPSNAVFAVHEARDGTIWIGTDAGLARLRGDRIWPVRDNGMLRGHRLVAFFEHDPPGTKPVAPSLYVVGERYLHEIRADSVRTLAAFPLLPSEGITVNDALYQPARQRLLLATSDGLVTADLRTLTYTATAPRAAVVQMRVGERPVPLPKGPEAPPVRLAYSRDNVTLTFAPLSFINERASRVQYRLNDRPWSAPTEARQVSFLRLPHGAYTFAVRAVNADGVLSSEPALLHFEIVPPFWRQPWFLALLLLAGTGALAAAVRYFSQRNLRHRLRQLETERRLQQERERISRDLHDHVGAQLSSIIAGVEIADHYAERNEPERVRAYLGSLDEDARETMLQLRETIWALHHESLSLEELATETERFAHQRVRYREGLRLHAMVSGQTTLRLSSRQTLTLFRIAQEAVSNAVRHAEASALHLSIHGDRAGWVRLTIRDDGRGGAAARNGHGLTNMNHRATELGGTFRCTSPPGGGTTVEVVLPVRMNGKSPTAI